MLRSDIQPSNRPAEDTERWRALLVALRQRRTYVLISIVAVVLIALGLAYPAFLAAPDHAHIVVTQLQFGVAPQVVFNQEFTAIAPQIYAALLDNPRIPAGAVQSCPASSSRLPYYHYQITFTRGGITTGVATSDAFGCEGITLDCPVGAPAYLFWYRPDGSSFWNQLSNLTGAPLPINALSNSIAARSIGDVRGYEHAFYGILPLCA